jgi:type II secretory pathway pseudopilin PulG
MTLLETSVALGLAGALLAISMQMFTVAARQQASEERRRAAVREAANAVERLGTVAYDDLTPERLDRLGAALALEDTLPGATLKFDVEPAEGPPAGKRIVVTVGWTDTGGPIPPPVTLVRWRYR